MKKSLFVLLFGLLLSTNTNATSVSATVTDAGAQAWAGGTYSFQFVPAPGFSGTPPATPTPGILDATGSFASVTVTGNDTLSPIGSRWIVQVCPAATAPCYSTPPIIIFGSTQNISSSITPTALVVSSSAGNQPVAYADAEIVSPVEGFTYFNYTSGALKTYHSGAWTTSSGSGGGITNTWIVQTTPCGTNTTCTQIHADGKIVQDGTSNSTTTVTCPDCAFTSADVGKTFWATNQGSGIGPGLLGNSTVVCPVTTIASVTNGTTAVLNLACTASLAGTAAFYWGTKDGATLHAMAPGCATVYFPSNANIFVDQSFLITVPSCATGGLTGATGLPQPSMFGTSSNTQLIMTPDFNWASCTGTGAVSGGVCIGSGLSQMWEFGIWGSGLNSGANANCANANGKTVLAMAPTGGSIFFVNMAGVCAGQAGLVGVELNSNDEQWKLGGAQNVGTTACVVSAKGVITESLDCINSNTSGAFGLKVLSGASLNDTDSYPLGSVSVSGNMNAHSAHFVGGNGTAYAITVNSGGVLAEDGDFINQDSGFGTLVSGLNVAAGGVSSARNTIIGGSSTVLNQAGTFIDECGNTVSGGGSVGSVSNPVFGNCSVQARVTNGLVGSHNTSITSTALIPTTATWSGEAYQLLITLQAFDIAAGASCSTNTTVVWTLSYNNALNAAETQTATETITTNGNATGGDPMRATFLVRINGGNAVNYSTVVTPGTGCSPVPSYGATFTVN